MSKFYVQCGSFELVTVAADSHSAALWAMHRYLSDRVALDSIDWDDPATIDRPDLIHAMLNLGDHLLVSEVGIGRSEAACLDTADVMTEWNQLMVAVGRLVQTFDHGG